MVRKKEEPAKGIVFKVGFEGKPDKKIEVTAYAFDRRGNFITSAPLREGQVALDVSEAQARGARIFFGPKLEGKREPLPTIRLMKRLRAYEARFDFEAEEREYVLQDVAEIDWEWWLWCICNVRGQVVKPVTLNNVTTNMPVCHAKVHICEIDPLWIIIPQLTDQLVFRIRDYILFERPPISPIPPEPGPLLKFQFDTAEADFSPENIARMNRPADSSLETTRGLEVRSNPQPEPPAAERYEAGLPALPAATRAALQSPSPTIVRQELLNNLELIEPYLCLMPWIWPYLYISQELAVIDTDAHGRFDTTIYYPCHGDHPDLYFWVEFSIGGIWETVYRRPIYCSTYWNYECGSEVVIPITDPRVPWCGDPESLPGKQVAVMSIGNKISLAEIQDSAAGNNEGLTTDGKPFGGSLEPHVWFGQEDLISNGITHYRWSYRRKDSGGDWHAIDRQVIRHYAVIDSNPPHNLTFKPFVLGPDPAFPTDNLFKIQPKDPPAGSYGWAPMIDARENTASAFFLSYLLEGSDAEAAAGKYELKLELFDSAGQRVNLDTAGVQLKIATDPAPFGQGEAHTVDAPEEYLIKDGSNKVIGFRMVLHVDNNPCEAEIYETEVDGTAAGDCGFIDYSPGDSAHISFKAYHPNNFATFNFGLYRGSMGEIIDASGSVGVSPVNGFEKDLNSVFAKNVLVTDLVGTCPDGAAAFSETLSVWAMATDGWADRLTYLDDHATPMAFALEPES